VKIDAQTAVISSMLWAMSTELQKTLDKPQSVTEIARLTAIQFNKMSPSRQICIQTSKNKIWDKTAEFFTEAVVDVGLPAMIETFYYSRKEKLDVFVGKKGELERWIVSLSSKHDSSQELTKNAYKVADKYVEVMNKYLYDEGKK